MQSKTLAPVHALLTVQTLVIVFGSINRLTSIFSGYVLPNEFLRWLDLNNLLVIPLISMVASYLLKKQIENRSDAAYESRRHMVLNVIFIVGVYLLAASYGTHEVTNYLHVRFCDPDASSTICQIIVFNDDEFSHWLFFAGFTLVNVVLLLMQALFPYQGVVSGRDRVLLIVNGLFIGAGIFANLGFEVIGLDLYVVAVLALLAVGLLVRRGGQPLFVYYSTAYVVGLVATVVVKILGVA